MVACHGGLINIAIHAHGRVHMRLGHGHMVAWACGIGLTPDIIHMHKRDMMHNITQHLVDPHNNSWMFGKLYMETRILNELLASNHYSLKPTTISNVLWDGHRIAWVYIN